MKKLYSISTFELDPAPTLSEVNCSTKNTSSKPKMHRSYVAIGRTKADAFHLGSGIHYLP